MKRNKENESTYLFLLAYISCISSINEEEGFIAHPQSIQRYPEHSRYAHTSMATPSNPSQFLDTRVTFQNKYEKNMDSKEMESGRESESGNSDSLQYLGKLRRNAPLNEAQDTLYNLQEKVINYLTLPSPSFCSFSPFE